MIPMTQWKWLGEPGHFILASRCQHHLHTHIGRFCVSTVGDIRDNPQTNQTSTPIGGFGDLYETMAFDMGHDRAEMGTKRYKTCYDADAGHITVCLLMANHSEASTWDPSEETCIHTEKDFADPLLIQEKPPEHSRTNNELF